MSTRDELAEKLREQALSIPWSERSERAKLLRQAADALQAQGCPKGWKLVPDLPDDEMIRAALAIEWPAQYRFYLRHPDNGPKTAEQTEARIKREMRRYAAMLSAAPTLGDPG